MHIIILSVKLVLFGGAAGVTVIGVGNGRDGQSSNHGRHCLHFT